MAPKNNCTNTYTWSAPSNTTDCVTDGYIDGWRAQSVMSRSCCICCMAKPCRWCWWPAACELPVSCPARQPATSQMTRWPTGMWCASVLEIKWSGAQWLGSQTAPLHVGLDCILVTPNRTTLWAFAWQQLSKEDLFVYPVVLHADDMSNPAK